ncbi:ABC transporter ATP-binding protein [Phyllobacterium myrsinacearum]|uniref:Peptide/nickel transport system ATP-binding protein n=1 Tax=Phyllobacterium myrsinacearum TaxID=28101 RepID=A0A839ES04_9HYPH|nr:ABC transporter ATP-binding protein [Phyllobacterium myrsinacearum]MBA8880978.1 peptide/nickel transport system ATP-binding protein [Phyllobacterium myrsinacearum]
MTDIGMKPHALSIENLSLEFPTYDGAVKALDGVTIQVGNAEIVGLVGESGCGKSVTTMAATRLLPEGRYKITQGTIRLFGRDPTVMSDEDLQQVRGKLVSTIFQEPMNALNPTIRIGKQLVGVIRRHEAISRAAAETVAANILSDMLIPEPSRIMQAYPFELSGGMRQRVLIAMAFSCNPGLIIADEPTTALDVTVQAAILRLIQGRARRTGTSVVFISHNIAVVSQICDRLYIMYAGRIVESGPTRAVLDSPQHPYTRALLRCLPERVQPKAQLESIPGTVPNLLDPPAGCFYRPRCLEADERCHAKPQSTTLTGGQVVACWQRSKSQTHVSNEA